MISEGIVMGDREPQSVDTNGKLPFAIMNCRTKVELATRLCSLAASFIVFGAVASLIPDQAVLAATYCRLDHRFKDLGPGETDEYLITHHDNGDGTFTDIYTGILHSPGRPDYIISSN